MTDKPQEAPKAQMDLRAAMEWAFLQRENCIVRDGNGIAKAIDYDKRTMDAPLGGQQFLDMAFTNPTAFNNHLIKVMGTDVDSEDEMVKAEKKSITELKKLLKRFEDQGKEKRTKARVAKKKLSKLA